MIKVLKPGLATSVQDLGREGYYHLGIPPSGALDQYALSAANHLVGNPPGAAGLECTLIGPELEFRRDALVALSGALMTPRLDGEVVHQDTAFQVRAGQVLRFDIVQGDQEIGSFASHVLQSAHAASHFPGKIGQCPQDYRHGSRHSPRHP